MAEQKYVTQQTIDKQKYSVFLRDLSKDLNLNLKHMVEDIIIDKEIQKKKEKKNHHKGKKVIKKKDLIIQEQNEKKRKNNIQEDYKRAEYLIDNLDYNDPFKLLHSIKTNEGIINYKFLLLNKYWKKKKKNMKYIILLYNDLKDEETKDNKKLIDEIKSVLDETEYKLFMMKKMGDMLPPLNNWNKEIKDFCEGTYGIGFPIMAKQSVVGKNKHHFYNLIEQKYGTKFLPKWNFHKYLIKNDGTLIKSYSSLVSPLSKKLVNEINANL